MTINRKYYTGVAVVLLLLPLTVLFSAVGWAVLYEYTRSLGVFVAGYTLSIFVENKIWRQW